ncbi:MAG: GrpB family protein [Verrucomicrobiota bacterium]|jgi:GrpB-like predicted nucleotidyltransferase (UPF0157 family)|nr:GrpB family protein [Verrucomicrobiota bacterium]
METLKEKVARVVKEAVEVVPYDPAWPLRFEKEKRHLQNLFPADWIRRIEHFGSTAVPGLCAKPIVDMLVEVRSLEMVRIQMAPVLEKEGYDYFWRPSFGDAGPPYYAWFIKRDAAGKRTHHLHMVEAHFEHWERLAFRDYIRTHPDVAAEYGRLKQRLAMELKQDRAAYTHAKGEFIQRVSRLARRGTFDGA